MKTGIIKINGVEGYYNLPVKEEFDIIRCIKKIKNALNYTLEETVNVILNCDHKNCDLCRAAWDNKGCPLRCNTDL